MNGARTLPASVLSGIKGKDISLNLDMENGFIWKINGTSITAETPADIDLSVTNTAEHIPAALYRKYRREIESSASSKMETEIILVCGDQAV